MTQTFQSLQKEESCDLEVTQNVYIVYSLHDTLISLDR